ncbi:MAG: hypothetical protein HC808_10145, partial [Candidatus Competibacteraceae bacterium]|nr:hypothetical protein [Candidatus Competibacteraceae bacterium]
MQTLKKLVGQMSIPGQKPTNVVFTPYLEKNAYEYVVVATTAYTALDKRYILVDDDTAGGAVTITLPAALDNNDRVYDIKKLGT